MDIKKLVENKLFESYYIVDIINNDSTIDVMCPFMTTAVLTNELINNFYPNISKFDTTTEYTCRYKNQTFYHVIVDGYMITPELIAKILNSNDIETNIVRG